MPPEPPKGDNLAALPVVFKQLSAPRLLVESLLKSYFAKLSGTNKGPGFRCGYSGHYKQSWKFAQKERIKVGSESRWRPSSL